MGFGKPNKKRRITKTQVRQGRLIFFVLGGGGGSCCSLEPSVVVLDSDYVDRNGLVATGWSISMGVSKVRVVGLKIFGWITGWDWVGRFGYLLREMCFKVT